MSHERISNALVAGILTIMCLAFYSAGMMGAKPPKLAYAVSIGSDYIVLETDSATHEITTINHVSHVWAYSETRKAGCIVAHYGVSFDYDTENVIMLDYTICKSGYTVRLYDMYGDIDY